MDAVREEMLRIGVTEEKAKDSVRWKQMSHCHEP